PIDGFMLDEPPEVACTMLPSKVAGFSRETAETPSGFPDDPHHSAAFSSGDLGKPGPSPRGTRSSHPFPSSGESCKPSVPKAMEGSRIGAGGRTARYRIFPVVAWCPAGTGLMWDPVPLQC